MLGCFWVSFCLRMLLPLISRGKLKGVCCTITSLPRWPGVNVQIYQTKLIVTPQFWFQSFILEVSCSASDPKSHRTKFSKQRLLSMQSYRLMQMSCRQLRVCLTLFESAEPKTFTACLPFFIERGQMLVNICWGSQVFPCRCSTKQDIVWEQFFDR